MTAFMIRFLMCNMCISAVIGILFLAKGICKNILSCRMQYNLWFLLLGLLAVPFIPLHLIGFEQIFFLSGTFGNRFASGVGTADSKAADANLPENTDWLNDFTLSVSQKAPSIVGYLLFGIWIVGILVMMVLVVRSALRLRRLEKSALFLQNLRILKLYQHCLEEMEISREIPIYSAAFLQSPMIVGLFKPRIYLPIHLISDDTFSHNRHLEKADLTNIRYILLHELQHYKYRDGLANFLMNLAVVIYWFNPLVWHALGEMRSDREIACDTSVLEMLDEQDYQDYGNTLINFAEKISRSPFPFAAGLGGNMRQMKRRIISIASYEKPTVMKRLKSMLAFLLIAILLLGLAPNLSAYAANDDSYQWKISDRNISMIDLSAYFAGYEGSFVLYDLKDDFWSIYDMEHAALRAAPDSTYKIYDALFGLEEGIITPEDSFLAWNGENYPLEAWNADQTLPSAMSASVNWYFQSIDRELSSPVIYRYLQQIGYGNETMGDDLSTYWMESSLKISPIEQVELLIRLQNHDLGFSSETVNTVKEAIRLSSANTGTLYGKTGTGRIDGRDVNGWFIGFVETADNTWFFAARIEADNEASGSNAAKIVMSILSDQNIWQSPTPDSAS